MKNPTLLVVLAAIIVSMILPVSQSIKTIIVIIILLGFLFLKRGYLFVALGSFFLNKKVILMKRGHGSYIVKDGKQVLLPPISLC